MRFRSSLLVLTRQDQWKTAIFQRLVVICVSMQWSWLKAALTFCQPDTCGKAVWPFSVLVPSLPIVSTSLDAAEFFYRLVCPLSDGIDSPVSGFAHIARQHLPLPRARLMVVPLDFEDVRA